MNKSLRTFAALIFSLAVFPGLAIPTATASLQRPALEQPAPSNPNPFRSLLRYLKHLIGVQPNDGGQVSPPHP